MLTKISSAHMSPVTAPKESLSVVGQDITEFSVAPANAHSVAHLDLSYNLLETVGCLRRFVGLRELVLDNNKLGTLLVPLLPFLHTLSLNNNRLHDLQALLACLVKSTPQLEYLSLLGNQLCPNELVAGDEEDYQGYRFSVINKLKYLKFLDSRRVTSGERRVAESRVEVLQVVRALQREDLLEGRERREREERRERKGEEDEPWNSPLDQDQNMDQKAGFGKRQYLYRGKNSEGNKYISNDDL